MNDIMDLVPHLLYECVRFVNYYFIDCKICLKHFFFQDIGTVYVIETDKIEMYKYASRFV